MRRNIARPGSLQEDPCEAALLRRARTEPSCDTPRVLSSDVAWLLRTARLSAADPLMRTASRFAAGDGVAAPVHRSQVTRWESGHAKVSHSIVRRYESVLRLPPGQILTAIDVLGRLCVPIQPLPALDRPLPQDSAAVAMPLMEQALGDGPLCAREWDQLSWLLGAMPQVLLRRSDCEVLMHRGLQEMAMTNGLSHLQRRESLARLAGNRRIGEVLPDLARHTPDDVDGLVCRNALSLLPHSMLPDSGFAAIRELEEPLNTDTLSAALVSTALLLRRGQLTTELADRACHLAWEHLCASQSDRVSRNSADVLLVLDIHSRCRLGRALLVQRGDAASAAVLSGASSHPSTSSRRLVARIRVHLSDRYGDALEDHPTLTRLLNQAGHETNDELHAGALAVLALSPMGPTIGVAYGLQLREALTVLDRPTAHEALRVLRWLPDPDALDLLTEIALDDTSTEDLVRLACAALSNGIEADAALAAGREDRIAGYAISRATEEPDGVSARSYAQVLGMRGRRDLLQVAAGVAAHRVGPVPRLGSYQYWLDLPGHEWHGSLN